MRFPVPGLIGVQSQQIVRPAANTRGWNVVAQNVGSIPIWIGDNQQALDSSIDPIQGIPSYGFILPPQATGAGSPMAQLTWRQLQSGLWVRTSLNAFSSLSIDQNPVTNTGGSSTATTVTLTPAGVNEFCFMWDIDGVAGESWTPNNGFAAFDSTILPFQSGLPIPIIASVIPSAGLAHAGGASWSAAALMVRLAAGFTQPTIVQARTGASGALAGPRLQAFTNPNKAGNMIVAAICSTNINIGASISDTNGNSYVSVCNIPNAGGFNATAASSMVIAVAFNIKSGANSVNFSYSGTYTAGQIAIAEYGGVLAPTGLVEVSIDPAC